MILCLKYSSYIKPVLSFVSKLMYRSNLYRTVTVRSRRWFVVYHDKLDVWNSQYSAKADCRLLTRLPKFTEVLNLAEDGTRSQSWRFWPTLSFLLLLLLFFFFHGWRTVTYNIYATNFLLGSVLTIEILAATPVTTDASKTGVTWKEKRRHSMVRVLTTATLIISL